VGTYTTLAEIKGSLSLSAQTYADADISNAIGAASGAVEQQTGRRFDKDSSDSSRQFVPLSPGLVSFDDLVSFTSLSAQGSTWVKDSDFYLEPINAAAESRPYTAARAIGRQFLWTQRELDPSFPNWDGRVTVTGTYGWPAVPPEINEATRILTIRLLRRVREATFGVVSLGLEGTAARIASVDPDVRLLLQPYEKSFLS